MEVLVAGLHSLKDLDGLERSRLLDDDGLEAALECGVLFESLAIFVESGGADALDLAAGQGGLEHIRRVDRAFRATGADDGVDLVDEEDDAA